MPLDLPEQRAPQGLRVVPDDAAAIAPPPSWLPVPVADAMRSGRKVDPPSVGRRNDGHALFYAGRTHFVFGASEALKTWLLLLAAKQEIEGRHHVVWLDFEDDEVNMADRLTSLCCDPEVVAEFFHFISPTQPLPLPAADSLVTALTPWGQTLTVFDGVTDLMGSLGLNPLENRDVSTLFGTLIRPFADAGSAVVLLDHISKQDAKKAGAEAPAPLGAQHKVSATSGACYFLRGVSKGGRGRYGMSNVEVVRDRPGFVVGHSSSGGLVGTLHVKSDAVTSQVDASLTSNSGPTASEPTHLMQRISEGLEKVAPDAVPTKTILDWRLGRDQFVRRALDCLVMRGYAETADGPRGAKLHRSIGAYRDERAPDADGELA